MVERGDEESTKTAVQSAWVRSLPTKLRLLQGKPRYVAGAKLQLCLVAAFVASTAWSRTRCLTTTYTSTTDPTANGNAKGTTCVENVAISQSYSITEDHVRSSSKSYVELFAYESTMVDHQANVAEINTCIEDINDYAINHTAIFNLLYMDYKPCQRGDIRVTAPVHWPYVFNIDNGGAYHQDLQDDLTAGALNYSDITGACSTGAERIGDVMSLSIDCTPTCRAFSPDAEDLCTGLYVNEPDAEKEVTMFTINTDSLARCLAVNHDILAWNDTATVSWNETTNADLGVTAKTGDAIQAIDPTTEFSNSIARAASGCYLYFTNYDATAGFRPVDDSSVALLNPPWSITSPDATVCLATTTTSPSQRLWRMRVRQRPAPRCWAAPSRILPSTSRSRSPAWEAGSDDAIDDDSGHPGCKRVLTPLPNQAPVDSFFVCESKVCNGWLTSLALGYANATMEEELLLTFVVTLGMYFARRFVSKDGSERTVLARHSDEDLELALMEMAVERSRMKEALNVPAD